MIVLIAVAHRGIELLSLRRENWLIAAVMALATPNSRQEADHDRSMEAMHVMHKHLYPLALSSRIREVWQPLRVATLP
jgi:hypothetical protein